MLNSARDLLLLRHGKSRWDELGISDHDRTLAPRGIKAAKAIGRWLDKRGLKPELVLCSSAARTQDTWSILNDRLQADSELKTYKSLYLATPSRIMDIVGRQPVSYANLLVIGHNPGMHRLALRLAGEQASAALRANMPTAALAHFRLTGHDWRDLDDVQLLNYIEPRKL